MPSWRAPWTSSGRGPAPATTGRRPRPTPRGRGSPTGPSPPRPRTAAAIAAWLAARVAGPLGIGPEEVDVRTPFASFGLGSLQAVSLAGELERWLGRPLAPTLI
jgi:acyl carrier protein